MSVGSGEAEISNKIQNNIIFISSHLDSIVSVLLDLLLDNIFSQFATESFLILELCLKNEYPDVLRNPSVDRWICI
jgi:hypothetical protein